MPKPIPLSYSLSVQRKDSGGRWREIASWTLSTTETDQEGPLNCGLKSNYRIVINETKPGTRPEKANDEPANGNMATISS